MANILPLHCPWSKGQKPTVATMELPSENSESSAGSLPAAERKDTFGMFSLPSPDLEQSGFGMCALLSPESEDGSGKHIILYQAISTLIPYFHGALT
jgi:hypothetical protein